MPSAMQILSHTHTKRWKTSFLTFLSCLVINKEMECIVTKSSGWGWQGRSDYANRSGSFNDGTQVTAPRTKHSHQPGPPVHFCKSRQKMPGAMLPTQPNLCHKLNKWLGPQNYKCGFEAASEGRLYWWPNTLSLHRNENTAHSEFNLILTELY